MQWLHLYEKEVENVISLRHIDRWLPCILSIVGNFIRLLPSPVV